MSEGYAGSSRSFILVSDSGRQEPAKLLPQLGLVEGRCQSNINYRRATWSVSGLNRAVLPSPRKVCIVTTNSSCPWATLRGANQPLVSFSKARRQGIVYRRLFSPSQRSSLFPSLPKMTQGKKWVRFDLKGFALPVSPHAVHCGGAHVRRRLVNELWAVKLPSCHVRTRGRSRPLVFARHTK